MALSILEEWKDRSKRICHEVLGFDEAIAEEKETKSQILFAIIPATRLPGWPSIYAA